MLAPSASEPTTVALVLAEARTFSGVPLVLTVPVADAQAADIGARAASSRPAPSASAERRTVRDRGAASGPVVLPIMCSPSGLGRIRPALKMFRALCTRNPTI